LPVASKLHSRSHLYEKTDVAVNVY
jgi:hypothetical protein